MSARGRSPGRGVPRSIPSARDCRKYAREFVRTDRDRDGLITPQEANAVFERGGLSRDTMARIYDLVDLHRVNHVGFKEFAVAMHLICAARGGLLPPQPPAGLPPDLIEFIRGLRTPPELLAQEGSSRSASAARSRSATPRGERPVPSQRDCRKYSREFQRMDANHDGALAADEVRLVFMRSGLPNDVLGEIYDLVDGSRSGRIEFPAFVAAMHLIRLARGGRPPPPSSAGLPAELTSYVQGLQASPAELSLQGSSRSASRSREEARQKPAAWSSPFNAEFGSATSPFGTGTAGGPAANAPPPFEASPSPFDSEAPHLGSPAVARTSAEQQLDIPSAGKKKKKKKGHHSSDHGHTEAASTGPFGPALDEPQGASSPGSPFAAARPGRSFGAPDPQMPRRSSPATRMGLPVPDPAAEEDGYALGESGTKAKDPYYHARLREILGLPSASAGEDDGFSLDSPAAAASRPGARSNEGVFDPHRSTSGDYVSPVMRTILMGAKPAPGASGGAADSKAAAAAAQPSNAAPFLRTIVPNYPRPQSASEGIGLASQHFGRPLPTVMPSVRDVREQLSSLPAAYTSQVPMSV